MGEERRVEFEDCSDEFAYSLGKLFSFVSFHLNLDFKEVKVENWHKDAKIMIYHSISDNIFLYATVA